MLNPAHEVHETQDVHELLLSTVKQVRALHATLSALMTDVAAIRRTFLHDRADMVLGTGVEGTGTRQIASLVGYKAVLAVIAPHLLGRLLQRDKGHVP